MLIASIASKLPTHPDFTVVQVLAAADFGWEYLIEDADGLAVLEEFLPSAETPQDLAALQTELQQSLQLARQVEQPQLAHSLAVLHFDDRLFCMREYVPGTRLQQYLTQLVTQGKSCAEDEVRHFLIGVLRPLAALHDRGLPHGAIDGNAIIWREGDDAIILQRVGGMREFGLAHHFYRLQPWLTSHGYADQTGIAKDLHDLAWLALLLLSGDDTLESVVPILHELHQTGVISHDFARILTPMLIPKPWQSFSDAGAVLKALLTDMPQPQDTRPSIAIPPAPTAAPPHMPRSLHEPTPSPPLEPGPTASSASPSITQDPLIMALSIVFIGLVSLSLWRIATVVKIPGLIPQVQPSQNSHKAPAQTAKAADQTPANRNANATKPTPAKTNALEKQGISAALYDQLVSEMPPSNQPPEQQINSVLKALSEASRREIGTYYRRNYDHWFATLASRKISQPTVDVLSDTAFYLQFPALRGKPLNPRTFGQIWYAIARDQITALNQQQNLKTLKAGSYNETGKLYGGRGRVFQVNVPAGQGLKLFLKTRKQDVRLSIIKNEIVLMRDSTNTQWTAPPSQRSAIYEILLTPARSAKVPYKISFKAL